MKQITAITSVAIVMALVAGCGPDGPGESPGSETAPDYEAEARESITAENMDAMLEQLEEEIAADEAEIEAED